MANRRFNGQAIYEGDLIEYKKGDATEIGEVREREGVYYAGGKRLSSLTGIKRVIRMGREEEEDERKGSDDGGKINTGKGKR
jgi:hypothetical protein